jgi:hypothetical protein
MKNIRFFLGVVPLVGACALFDSDDVCTLIGGNSGLTIRVSNVTSSIVRIEVNPYGAGRQPAYVADCAGIQGGCSSGVFFPEYSAPSAAITVVMATDTVSGTILLTYEVTHPNGPGCEPRLVNASVVVDARNGFVTNGS